MNSMLVSWILKTIDPKLAISIPYFEKVKLLWDYLEKRYYEASGPCLHLLSQQPPVTLEVHIMPSFKKNVPEVLLKPKHLRQRRMPIFLLFVLLIDGTLRLLVLIKRSLFALVVNARDTKMRVIFSFMVILFGCLKNMVRKEVLMPLATSPPFLFPLRLMLLLPRISTSPWQEPMSWAPLLVVLPCLLMRLLRHYPSFNLSMFEYC